MIVVVAASDRMTQWKNTVATGSSSLPDIVGVLADAQTYKNLLYLLLAFPLGVAYYVLLVLGFALGIGLSVLVVGLGILLVTVVGLRFIASFERRLANALLGTAIPRPEDVEEAGGSIVDTAKAYIQAPSTWKGLGFVVLKFPIGILSFVLLVTFLGTALELLLVPLFPGGVFNVQLAGWEVARSFEATAGRVVAVPAGIVLGFVALHVLNVFAAANASVASSLLGPDQADTADGEPPT